MSGSGERVERLRERIASLVKDVEAAHEALARAQEDQERLGGQLEAAKQHLAKLEEARARALAESYRQEEPETQAVREAEEGLEEARRAVWDAESDRTQATRALELLRTELETARRRLAEGATVAKAETATELREELKLAWRPARSLVDEMRAVSSVEHGDEPALIGSVERAAARFEREALEGEPAGAPAAALEPPATAEAGEAEAPAGPGAPRAGRLPWLTARVRSLLGRGLVLLGGAGLVAGAFLEWLRPFGAAGTDLDLRAYYEQAFFEGTGAGRPSAGGVTILLGALLIVLVFLRLRWLTLLGGVLAIAAMVLYGVTVVATPELSLLDIGLGAWLSLLAALVATAGGFLWVTSPKASSAPTSTAEPAAPPAA